jgi:hypothetical protein
LLPLKSSGLPARRLTTSRGDSGDSKVTCRVEHDFATPNASSDPSSDSDQTDESGTSGFAASDKAGRSRSFPTIRGAALANPPTHGIEAVSPLEGQEKQTIRPERSRAT